MAVLRILPARIALLLESALAAALNRIPLVGPVRSEVVGQIEDLYSVNPRPCSSLNAGATFGQRFHGQHPQ